MSSTPARQELNSKFGHAEQDIEDAQQKVDSINSSINGTQNTINDYESASWLVFWFVISVSSFFSPI